MPQMGQSFGLPIRTMYDVGLFDFGGGAAGSYYLSGPLGSRGIVKEIIVSTTEVFHTDTADGTVEIGTVADADAYASCTVPDNTLVNTVYRGADGYGDDVDAIIADIPANTHVKVTLTNGTAAASVTGQGYVQIFIDWI